MGLDSKFPGVFASIKYPFGLKTVGGGAINAVGCK